ncbi:MAG: hypothetical protein IJF33_02645, partial [Clostridia bacterium]|nr:hypothetical protein [Clostridia bacterium]
DLGAPCRDELRRGCSIKMPVKECNTHSKSHKEHSLCAGDDNNDRHTNAYAGECQIADFWNMADVDAVNDIV